MAAGHDGYAGRSGLEADVALVEIAHHAVGGRETERAATGQDDGVHFLNGVDRVEQGRLARSRRGAANVDGGDGAILRKDDGATGGPFGQRMVPDRDAFEAGQPLGFPLRPPGGPGVSR